MKNKLNIIGLSGSLRKGSYNKILVKRIGEIVSKRENFEYISLKDIPLYNEDLENENFPVSVKKLKTKVEESDGIVIATPEYNGQMPGVLKNALDWTTRPAGQNSFDKKVLGIVGATPGGFGTIRAQNQLVLLASTLNMHILHKPQIMLSKFHKKVNEEEKINDENTLEKLRNFVDDFLEFSKKYK
ncbi:NADPH-dependent FMN reductase [Candidatus Dojkabacteria bacterium]|nr:NADPH-dependent FMN reductase [Candidatus Dojkabacteria bacterium]